MTQKHSYYRTHCPLTDDRSRAEWAACRREAKDYLKAHPKAKYYRVKGDSPNLFACLMDEETNEIFAQTYLAYTDAEVQRVKDLVVELYNKTAEHPVQSFEEVRIANYDTLRGQSEELDALLFDRAAKDEIIVKEVFWDNPVTFYHFSYCPFDMEKQEMDKRQQCRVALTDEEYLYLLTEQLYDWYFSFNYLLRYNPSLAQRINEVMKSAYDLTPCLILFDELREDMDHIRPIRKLSANSMSLQV